jgi:hypothetical protein
VRPKAWTVVRGITHAPLDRRGWLRGDGTKRVTTSWLIVNFGEHEVMAQLIARRVLISALINKDFPVRHPFLACGNFASVNLNHQK